MIDIVFVSCTPARRQCPVWTLHE